MHWGFVFGDRLGALHRYKRAALLLQAGQNRRGDAVVESCDILFISEAKKRHATLGLPDPYPQVNLAQPKVAERFWAEPMPSSDPALDELERIVAVDGGAAASGLLSWGPAYAKLHQLYGRPCALCPVCREVHGAYPIHELCGGSYCSSPHRWAGSALANADGVHGRLCAAAHGRCRHTQCGQPCALANCSAASARSGAPCPCAPSFNCAHAVGWPSQQRWQCGTGGAGAGAGRVLRARCRYWCSHAAASNGGSGRLSMLALLLFFQHASLVVLLLILCCRVSIAQCSTSDMLFQLLWTGALQMASVWLGEFT